MITRGEEVKKLIKRFFGRAFGYLKYCHYDNVYNGYREKYDLDKEFRFNGERTIMYGEGRIIIGKGTVIGIASMLNSQKGCTIRIGKNTLISHFVKIYTFETSNRAIGDIEIGDNCLIGTGVFIKKGVKIGNNTFIGANAVVTKNIPSNCTAVGVPARVTKKG